MENYNYDKIKKIVHLGYCGTSGLMGREFHEGDWNILNHPDLDGWDLNEWEELYFIPVEWDELAEKLQEKTGVKPEEVENYEFFAFANGIAGNPTFLAVMEK